MIDFNEARLSPPSTAPSLSRRIITVLMTYLLAFWWLALFICAFLSISSALKGRQRRQTCRKSSWPLSSARCFGVIRSPCKEVGCMRRLQKRLGVCRRGPGFPVPWLCCCWLPVATGPTASRSGLWSVISSQCLANDTVWWLRTTLARNCCRLEADLWLEIWAAHHPRPLQ